MDQQTQDSWEDFLDSELTALGMSDKKTIQRVKWYYQTYFKDKYNKTHDMEQKEIQEKGVMPLPKDHICFERGHAMFNVYILHNHHSSYGQNKCGRCGYEEDWQYDFPYSNPMFKEQQNT
jgi:hypothetical protein